MKKIGVRNSYPVFYRGNLFVTISVIGYESKDWLKKWYCETYAISLDDIEVKDPVQRIKFNEKQVDRQKQK